MCPNPLPPSRTLSPLVRVPVYLLRLPHIVPLDRRRRLAIAASEARWAASVTDSQADAPVPSPDLPERSTRWLLLSPFQFCLFFLPTHSHPVGSRSDFGPDFHFPNGFSHLKPVPPVGDRGTLVTRNFLVPAFRCRPRPGPVPHTALWTRNSPASTRCPSFPHFHSPYCSCWYLSVF